MVGMHAIMAYGFYKYFHGVREQRYVSGAPSPSFRSESISRNWVDYHVDLVTLLSCLNKSNSFVCSELAREKMWARLYLTPLLQAEEDRDQVRRYYADKERANKLFGDDQKVYNSDRYVISAYPGHVHIYAEFSVCMRVRYERLLIALLSASFALLSPIPPVNLPNKRSLLWLVLVFFSFLVGMWWLN